MEDARRPARWGAGGWTALSPCGDVTQQQTEGPCRPGGPVTTPENVVPARRIPSAKPHIEGPHAREVSQTGESRDTWGEQSSPGAGRGVGAPSDRGSMRGQPADARGNDGNMPRAVAVRAAQPRVSDSE